MSVKNIQSVLDYLGQFNLNLDLLAIRSNSRNNGEGSAARAIARIRHDDLGDAHEEASDG